MRAALVQRRPLDGVCTTATGGLRLPDGADRCRSPGLHDEEEQGTTQAQGLGTSGQGKAGGPGAKISRAHPASRRPASMSGAHKEPCHASAGKEGPGGTAAALCSPVFTETDLCT